MKSKKIICTLALTTVIFGGSLLNTTKASTISSHRIAGNDRYETSQAISQSGWTTANTVILASGEMFPDALCTGPLAKKYNAPILLTSSQSISAETMNELSRLKAKDVIIIGGTGAISANIESELKSKGYNTDRIGGKDRYETSAMIAARLDSPSEVVIASGENFPDALSISTIASKLGMPILLSPRDGLSDYAKTYISNNNITKAYIVGGTGVLSTNIEKDVPSPTRLSGQDRYGTNLAIIKAFESNLNYDNVYLTSDQSFADALSGAVLASNSNSPIILTNQSIDKSINDYLKNKITLNSKAVALGGAAVVADSLIQNLTDNKAAISVAKNYNTQGNFSDETVKGSAIIGASGVYLKNATIEGDLLIASTVGDGMVDLDNVTVTGKIIVNGGGEQGVSLHNMTAQIVELDKSAGNNVKLVTDATSSIASILVNSNGIVDTTNTSKVGNVTVNQQSNVSLKGNYDTIQVKGRASNVSLQDGSIKNLDLASTATGSKVDIANTSTVNILNVNATVSVTGNGKITTANITANGATIESKPINLVIASGVTSTVGGETKESSGTTDIKDLSDGGNHVGNYVISSGGTFGDSVKTTSISGNVSIDDSDAKSSDEIVLQNMNIIGSLTVDFGAGNVILNNVTVNGINVKNVGANSLHVKGNSVIENLTVNDPNNDAHIVVEDNAMIAAATVLSGANLEVAATATNAQPFSNITLAPTAEPAVSNQVMLTGAFDTVNVASAAKVVLAPNAEIKTQIIAKAPLEFIAPVTAKVSKVNIQPSHATDTFVLNGNLDNVNVSAVSNVQVKSGNVKVSSSTNAAVNVIVAKDAIVNTVSGSAIAVTGGGTIVTREKSAEAKVTSIRLGNGKINESEIMDLPAVINARKLLYNLLVSPFATAQVVDGAGNSVSDDTIIDNTMKLKVTAENGTTINNYSLRVAALPTFEINYPTVTTGTTSSKEILVTTKANQPGRVYIVAVPSGATAPTSAQVKMGTDATGKFVASTSKDLQAGVIDIEAVNVENYNTKYDIYVVLAGSNGALQLKPTKLTASSPVAPAEDKILKSTEILPDIKVNCSKDQPNLNLPTEIGITTTDGINIKAKVVWNNEAKGELGEIVFTGKVELPSGVVNSNNVSLMVTQKVIIVATLDDLKNEISNVQNMLNIPVGNNPGDCPEQAMKDELINVVTYVKQIVEKSTVTQEEINNAFYKLQNVQQTFVKSIITGLMPIETSNAVIANSTFHQSIGVRIAGPGKFIENLSPNNIVLGGDFAGLTVKSVSVPDVNKPWEAKIELDGNLSIASGAGTVTVNAAGWNGPNGSKDITAKVKVMDPNALNLVWPMDNGFIYNNKCINIGFDNDIQIPKDWSQITVKDSTGVQVPVTGVYSVGSTKELGIECSSIVDGQYILTIPENTIVDVNGQKHNKAINIKFNIKFGNVDGTSSNNGNTINFNNVDITTLKNEILNVQNMLNIPVGNNPGDCPEQAIKDELINVVTYVKQIVEKSDVTQEEINNAFYKLQNAQQTFMKSIPTGLMPTETSNAVTANSSFHQTIGVRIAGPGKFIENLSPNNIVLGGDFTGLTVKSVVFPDVNKPWEAKIELDGNLSIASGAGTVTVNAAGWNGPNGSNDITAKVKVMDPNALNLVWPMDNGFIYNNKCINIGFDKDIQIPKDWSQITVKDSTGVQVPVTGVYSVGSTRELGIECSSITDGQYILTIPENTIADANGEKYNKAINIKFNVKFGNEDGASSNNVDIATLKNALLNVQNMINIPVGNNPGDCPEQVIKDELINVVTYVKQIVEKSDVTQEEINNAFYKLQNAQQTFMKSILTGLMPIETSNAVIANSTFHQSIGVRIAGPGKFIDNLSPNNIVLGGDFAGLTVKSVSVPDVNKPWEANIELEGSLNSTSGTGTVTVNAAGWNRPNGSNDITAKVKVTDPNALNVVWPMDNGFTYNYKGINLGFDNEIKVPSDWSQIIIKDSNGVQIPVTSVHNAGSTKELGIECASIGNGKYTLTIPENTLLDVSGQKHNKAINITFNVKLANIDIATLKNEISFTQNMTNIPVGNNPGNCPDQSIKDAFITVLANAQAVAGNSSVTQEEINKVFYELREAQQAFQAKILTGLMPSDTNNAITANSAFHQSIGVRIAGPGKFIDNLSPNNIVLGGDFAGLTVKSVSVPDVNKPWEAKIELEGSLNSTSGTGTVTVNASGWNSISGLHDITASIKVNSVVVVP